MSICRAIPPSAAPISMMELMQGFLGIVRKGAEEKLETGLKKYFGAEHVFLVSSGKAALFLILAGLHGMTGRRKVILPAYTCFSVPSAVRFAGLDIVLCDIVPETLDFDYSRLERLIAEDTLCVVSTHLFGIPADTPKVRGLCKAKGAFVVEDAAQAMGVVHEGNPLGTGGDVGFFSLGRGKNITCGSGGIVITTSDAIADAIRARYDESEKVPTAEYLKTILEIVFMMIFLRPGLFGLPKRLPFLKLGETRFYRSYPVRKFTGFQAGLLRDWSSKIERLNRTRILHGDRYMTRLGLSGRMPIYSRGYSYNRFPVFSKDKRAKDALCEEGDLFGITPMYPSPVHRIPELRGSFDRLEFGGADRVSDTLVTLPTHILLDDRDSESISERVERHRLNLQEEPCT
ncbi:MAG: DegT/DnrJ/EryC1/StrS family aminotransferase [Deltaproteobacteria bacterium]|nr:DegT/DnrJ/EryC1/StrS family aminotransferase [Deltaproteobacteria bacterium]